MAASNNNIQDVRTACPFRRLMPVDRNRGFFLGQNARIGRHAVNRYSKLTLVATICLASAAHASDRLAKTAALEAQPHEPEFVLSDNALKLQYGEERVVLPRGLQPSLLVTKSDSIVLQGQLPEKP